MKRKSLAAALIFMLVIPFFAFSVRQADATPSLAPFTPHETRVLVVSPADVYYSGANYLSADLARYGFNITLDASNDAVATNYLTDPKTSNLSQYDVVIVHGILGFPTSRVSAEEVAHFTSYRGVLILIGNALFQNESSGSWWGLDSEPVRSIEQRLGVDFTSFLGAGGAWHNSGTFELRDSSIKGLPPSLSYETRFKYNGSISFQMDLATNGAGTIYNFTVTSSPSLPLVGKTTSGVTFYRAGDGAVGIYIQGSYVYAASPSANQIEYFGLTDTSKRSALMASLIAYASEKDVDTIIKPQPLASIVLDRVGQYYPQAETYLNASLYNFNSVLDACNITPTIGFIDFLYFKHDFWQTDASRILSQLEGKYGDWEYSTDLRYPYSADPRPMTKEQIVSLLDNINGNYSMLGMNLYSTIIAPGGRWNQSTLDAMVSKNLYLLDILDTDAYYSDWWNLRANSSVIVHNSAPMLPERIGTNLAENFTQPNLDRNSIHYKYFSRRDKFALAAVNGFVGLVHYVPNFRWNEVGTYSLRTVYENLTSEIPDIRFVPLMEAGLYFGNKWMRIENASRAGSIIEFDVDASATPSVVGIGKGMLWPIIHANEPIQEVSIDNNPWFYFDDHSIRMPASVNSSHVKIVLGASQGPRIVESRYEVVEARYDGYRFYVSVSSTQGLNVSVRLFLPKVGPFREGNWSAFSQESGWHYDFDSESRILEFWAVSDGFATLEVGVFWSIELTPPSYNSSVTITLKITGLQNDIQEVTLSHNMSDKWSNTTMAPVNGLWVATIPAMPYRTVVRYRLFISDTAGHSLVSGIFNYSVIDEIPPEVGAPTWEPLNPVAGQSISVKVSVTEPDNASGVQKVVLWYFLGTDITGLARATSTNMTLANDNLWTAAIPGQSDGATVTFLIFAYDEAGNVERTEWYSYEVRAPPIFPISSFQIMLVGISVLSGIGIVLYFVKFKKRKISQSNEPLKEQIHLF